MAKNKRTQSHSTAIHAVSILVNHFTSMSEVTKISLGIIDQCKPIRGNRRVKILRESGCYLLKVRDIASIQDLRIYSTTPDFEKLISERLKRLGFDIKEE